MTRRSVLQNAVALHTGEVSARLAQIVAVGVIGQELGPKGLGIVGTGWALYSILLPVAQNAPEIVGMRQLAARPRRLLSTILEICLVKLSVGVVAALSIMAIALVLYGAESILCRQVIAQGLVLVPVALAFAWVFRGQQRFDLSSGLRVLHAAAYALVLYASLSAVPDPLVVPVVEAMLLLAMAFVGGALLHGTLPSSARAAPRWLPQISRARWQRSLRRHAVPVVTQGLGGVAAAVSWWAPVLAAGLYLSASEVGYVTGALRIVMGVHALVLASLQLFLPILARESPARSDCGRDVLARLLVYTFVITVVGAAAIHLLSPWICVTLLGAAFAPAGALLDIAVFAIVPAAVGSVFSYALLSSGEDRAFLLFMAVGAAVAVGLSLVLFAICPLREAFAAVIIAAAVQAAGVATYCVKRGFLGAPPRVPQLFSPQEIKGFLKLR